MAIETSVYAVSNEPIKGVYGFDSEGVLNAVVGEDGVTAITPYLENGQTAGVPWVCVWKGDKLSMRYNCAFLSDIHY